MKIKTFSFLFLVAIRLELASSGCAGNCAEETPETAAEPVVATCIDAMTAGIVPQDTCSGTIVTGTITNCPATNGTNQICMYFDDSRKDLSYPFTCNTGEGTFSYNLTEQAVAMLYTGDLSCSDLNDEQSDFFAYMQIYQRGMTSMSLCTAGTCPTPARRRELVEAELVDSTEKQAAAVLQECGDHDYDIYLHITGHLSVLAVPGREAKQVQCPYIMAHAVISDTVARKELELWNEQKSFEEFYPTEGSVFLASRPLKVFSSAYLDAEVTSPDIAMYDAVKNNCANFAISLGSKLDIKIDEHVTSFITRRLLEENGQDLAEKIRKSLHFPSLLAGRGLDREEVVSEEDLVQILVKMTANELLH